MWNDERWGSLLDRWEWALRVEESRLRSDKNSTPFRRAGADVGAVEAVERRIGRRLPPSYRSFLLATDGFRADGWGAAEPFGSKGYGGLLPASRVMTMAWADPSTVLRWAVPDTPFGRGPFDPDDLVAFLSLTEETRYELPPVGHLLHAVAVSGPQQHGNIVLDPLIVDAAGEWEAWRWDADGCTRFASFGSLVEQVVAEAEQVAADPGQPAPSGVRAEARESVARLDSTADEGTALVEDLRRRCLDGSASERAPWLQELGAAPGPRAAALAIDLLRDHPDDVPLVGNLATAGGWFGSAAALGPVIAALRGAHGEALASSIVHRWPEPIEQAYAATGDPRLLRHLLFARRRGSLIAAVEALARPNLDPEVCTWLSYTLSHSTAGHPDEVAVEAIVELGDRAGVSRYHLVEALIPISPGAAVSMLERALIGGANADAAFGTVDYMLWALASEHLADAVPALVACLHNDLMAQEGPLIVRTLACLDHKETVPALAAVLDGPLHEQALLALEQVAVSPEMACAGAARDALAVEVSGRHAKTDALSALARTRHPSAVAPLLALRAHDKRAAIAGLADVESPDAASALEEATSDADDETAAAAIHGLLRAKAAAIEVRAEWLESAIEALGNRQHPVAGTLARRWLATGSGGS